VIAIDLDPAALDHTRRSLAAARMSTIIDVRRAAVAALTPSEVDGRVLLANVPTALHLDLLERITTPPPAAVLSGMRIGEGAEIARRYRQLDLRTTSVARSGRWERWTLLQRA
jgi:ribosomal protein L11 methylase PrmA